jgi:PAS domain S-box-containing protein
MVATRDWDSTDALRESERRLRLAVEAAQIGIWDWNVLTNEIVWSEEAKAIAGLPPAEPVTFEQISGITHPDDLPRTSAMARHALDPALRSRQQFEYRLLRPDGEVRWVIANGEAVFASVDGQERPVHYIGTIRDITERKRAEADLRQSEARLRIATDAARLGIWEYEAASGALRGSPELNRLLGIPADARLDLEEIANRCYPGDAARVRAAGEAAVRRGERFFDCEFRLYLPDATLRWLLVRAEILLGADAEPSRALGALIDITERKQAEERQVFLMRELIHRVRNTLASVRAIAGSTLRGARNLKEAEAALSARIAALADVHMLLSGQHSGRADLRELVKAIIEPYRSPDNRIAVSGPSLVLDERESVALSMALHELATNATKYGALSSAEGRVELAWDVAPTSDDEVRLQLAWRECNGPPVKPPRRRGFGMRLIEQALAGSPSAEVQLNFAPDGLVCTIAASIAQHRPSDRPGA